MTRRSRGANSTLMLTIAAVVALVSGQCARAQDSWDAIYLGGSKTGWVHTFVKKVQDRGRDYLNVRVDIEQTVKRGKDFSVTKLMYGTIETLDGQVLRLDTLTEAGTQKLRAHGDVIKGEMELVLEGTGERQKLTIPWGPDVRGPYAPEQSMAKKPMTERETRTLKMFMPDLNKICQITLQARGIEPVVLGDGAIKPLLRVEQTTKVDGKPRPEFDATLWADSGGQLLKTEQDIFGGVIMFRTTEKAAKSPGGPIQFDMIKNTLIKLARDIPDPEKARLVKYRLTLKEGNPAEAIMADPRQTLQPGADGNTAILEVKRIGPLDGEPGPAEVDPQYLKPNALVTSQDRQVRALAQRATRGVTDPWQKAVRINDAVYKYVEKKTFEVAFAAANEVARNRSGDCTEHSVLAAAMCRAVGIPSRVAVGLVYVDEPRQELKGFGYHMWIEVYVNQRWVALDPTFDQSDVDAVHLKLSESSLQGVSPFEMFLPILRVAGKLEIEPIELR
ncbi:MAG: transglutaminase-like domain-containing protein [Isosphaeraceae bacterium]